VPIAEFLSCRRLPYSTQHRLSLVVTNQSISPLEQFHVCLSCSKIQSTVEFVRFAIFQQHTRKWVINVQLCTHADFMDIQSIFMLKPFFLTIKPSKSFETNEKRCFMTPPIDPILCSNSIFPFFAVANCCWCSSKS
jgi:hypothetical protein